MNKVMWLLDRASHLTPGEFHDRWLIRHAQDIISDQVPHLKRCIVDVRVADVDDMAGTPDRAPESDGMQGHGLKPRPTTAPSMAAPSARCGRKRRPIPKHFNALSCANPNSGFSLHFRKGTNHAVQRTIGDGDRGGLWPW